MTEKIIQMLKSGENDLEWYKDNLSYLKNYYNEKYIAFKDKKIIDFDSDIQSLVSRLRENGVEINNTFIKFITKIKSVF